MNGAYLDFAATSPIIRFPIDTSKQWRNPNAAYAHEERKVLMDCEERIKAAIGAKGGKVLYFRCATEALEWLYKKSNDADEFMCWAYSPYEHDAAAFDYAANPNELLCSFLSVRFYCHQLVNQLTGQIHDIKAVHEQLLQYDDVPFLICDCTAAIGKTSLTAAHVCDYADAVVTSGHKYGCPDIAFMWIDDRLFDWLGGGKDIRNQWGLKHGSLSVGHVLALVDAVEWACDMKRQDDAEAHYGDLAICLELGLNKAGIEHEWIGDADEQVAAINAIRLNGINADSLQSYLASNDIYVGVGHSSCSESANYNVLNAYGLSNAEASEVIRLSFAEDTAIEDIDALVKNVCEYKKMFLTN